MAVVDFRSGGGGFVGAQPRQVRDYPYGQDPRQMAEADWQESQWDEERYYTDADGEPMQEASIAGRVQRLTHYLGAVVSVGLMVMLAVWGYKLVMRDVSGVPVIRALEGEARTAPEDPGGQLAARTGLAVNNVAAGAESGPANQVAIAPEATGLAEDDVPMGQLGATARQPSRETELPINPIIDPIIAMSDADVAAARELANVEAAVTNVPVNDGPVNEAVTDLEGHVAAPEAINAVLAEAAQSAAPTAKIAASPRPAPRPRRVAAVAPTTTTDAAPAPAAAPAAAPAPKVEPSAVPSGSTLVQIGAFDSNALASGEWQRLSGKFGGLFSGKSQVIQQVDRNGRAFWRLRVAGFDSREDARRFCAELISGGVDCIPASAQ